MRLDDMFQTALKGVTVNLLRSLLTMLGIIIGVGSVTLMSSIGQSMKGVILGQISSLGAKSMVIFPGREEGGPGARGAGYDSLTEEDLRALKQLGTTTNYAPTIFFPGMTTYGREETNPQVLAVTETFFGNQDITAAQGRLIDDADNEGARAVALLGHDPAEELFGDSDPLGKRIQIGSTHFTVIGVTKPLGSQFFQNADDRIYVPYALAKNVTGQKYINQITMLATGEFTIAVADVKSLLRQRHKIDNPEDDQEKDDFIVHTSAEAGQILSTVSLGLTAFITTIAAISLLVGGIGIMNIMLVSVTERTREIGLRKAIGAKRRDILLQFLTESVLLTLTGGAIGLLLGIALAFLISFAVTGFLSTYVFAVSWGSIGAALLMAGVTGLLFGISPARRAAALHPMEALRYE